MSLDDYQFSFSGNPYGANPAPATFAQLGVTAAKVVKQGGGNDYAEITVDTSVGVIGALNLPFTRFDLRNPQGTLVFSGWLMQPARRATANKQQQTFRLDGPMSRLENVIFRQPWTFILDPTKVSGPMHSQNLSKVILNLENFTASERTPVKKQVQAALDFALAAGVPVDYLRTGQAHGLDAIPPAHPPEDEQSDINVADVLKRQFRWVPKLSVWWEYANGTPTLAFSAADPPSEATVTAGIGGPSLPVGTACQILPGGDGMAIDLNTGRIVNFNTDARFDLVVGKLKIDYLLVVEATEGSVRQPWLKIDSEQSPADGIPINGSLREMSMNMELRGSSIITKENGVPAIPGEHYPIHLAECLHAPYAVLTHDVKWSTEGVDVEWETRPGMAVTVLHGGDEHPIDARSILQVITRDLRTGSTEYQAGTPAQLGLGELLTLLRNNRTRCDGRDGGVNGGGGYMGGAGPVGQQYGFPPRDQSGGGSGTGNGGGNTSPGGNCDTDHSADTSRANQFYWPCSGAGGAKSVTIGAGGEPTLVITDVGDNSIYVDLGALADLGAPNGTVITLRAIDVCDGGTLKKQIFLCSQPFASGS